MAQLKNYDLENRLINFAGVIIKLAGSLPDNYLGKHLGNQLIRSGTSPALNYGEAQGAESSADFKHKMSICLKELRESQVCLKIILSSSLVEKSLVHPILSEANELVAIFTTSVSTLNQKLKNRRPS